MAKVVYKSYNPNDSLLLPPCLGDYLPENHQARVVSMIIDNLDIRDVENSYEGGGTSSYNPRMLLKVIVYAYLINVHSGRKMAKLLLDSIAFMWLSGRQTPDFRTINRFRSERLSDGRLKRIFAQVVNLLYDEGLVSLDVQYIDGTKIESVANKYTFVWRGSTEKNKAKLESRVKEVLEAAEQELAMENEETDQELTSEEMNRRADRILEKMDAEGMTDKKLRKDVEKVKAESSAKMKEYEDKLETLGERNSYSKTDPDATFLKMKEDAMNNGQTKPGYNVQIATENQYITNYGIFWRPTDQGTFIPFLKSFVSMYGRQSKAVVADSGYGSEQNYAYLDSQGIEAYVKYNMFHAEEKKKYKSNAFLQQNLFYNEEGDYYVCPMGQHMTHVGNRRVKSDLGYESSVDIYRAERCCGCPLRCLCYKGKSDRRTIEVNKVSNEYKRRAKELLTSEMGLYHRSMRPIEPEAVFGDLKFNHGFKRFCLKGNEKVDVEFGLVALAHNLRKYAKTLGSTVPKKATSVALELENKENELNKCA